MSSACALLALGFGACTFPEYDLDRSQRGAAGTAAMTFGGAAAGSAGAAGQPSDCIPSTDDVLCDGLDQGCVATTRDSGCERQCTGLALDGTSYMACAGSYDFADAEAKCQAQGMHLIRVDSDAENELALDFAEQLGPYVWLGGSNRQDSDVFAWNDGDPFYRSGAPIPGRYHNFAAGQPQSMPISCVQLERANSGAWSNTRCTDTQELLCERY